MYTTCDCNTVSSSNRLMTSRSDSSLLNRKRMQHCIFSVLFKISLNSDPPAFPAMVHSEKRQELQFPALDVVTFLLLNVNMLHIPHAKCILILSNCAFGSIRSNSSSRQPSQHRYYALQCRANADIEQSLKL